LTYFGITAEIIYVNPIEKANSKQMIEMFDIPMTLRDEKDLIPEDCYLVLVDSQPGNANISCLGDDKIAVIDHHKDLDGGQFAFSDIRPNIGACATIIATYYCDLDVPFSMNVATALVYGIMNDTNNLTRLNNKLDLEMFYYLYDLANLNKIKNIKMNEIGRDDIQAYAKALANIEIYKNIGFVHIEDCNDSLLGTISDMVYTIEGVNIVVSYARRYDGVKLSIRSGLDYIYADQLVKFIIDEKGLGGGHNEMAGGFIPIENIDFIDYRELDTYVRYRAIAFLEKERAER
jgi:nanoRNase/pAp phosphatase (c-di-AMP/oligoRNAs hydrolase)